MKKAIGITLLLLIIFVIPTPTQADNLDSFDQWTEVNWGTWYYPCCQSQGPLSVSHVSSDGDWRGTSLQEAWVSKKSFSLDNSFQFDAKYFFPESFESGFIGMAIGFAQFRENAEDYEYYATPSFTIGRDSQRELVSSIHDYAPTKSENGSIRMKYDAVTDTLKTTVSSFDEDGKQITKEVLPDESSPWIAREEFKNSMGSDKVRLAFQSHSGVPYGFGPVPEGTGYFYDVKVTAAPEPITTTLFLVGGGLMGLNRLRKRKT